MSEADNIERFKQMVGRVLGALYSEHPADQERAPSLVFGHNTVPDDKDADLFDNTVSYLIENRYLTVTGLGGYIRLNDKAFEVLQKPNPLAPERTIGAQLAGWAKGSASSIATDAAGKLAGAALGALYKAITVASVN